MEPSVSDFFLSKWNFFLETSSDCIQFGWLWKYFTFRVFFFSSFFISIRANFISFWNKVLFVKYFLSSLETLWNIWVSKKLVTSLRLFLRTWEQFNLFVLNDIQSSLVYVSILRIIRRSWILLSWHFEILTFLAAFNFELYTEKCELNFTRILHQRVVCYFVELIHINNIFSAPMPTPGN